jgi:hypothetical protein
LLVRDDVELIGCVLVVELPAELVMELEVVVTIELEVVVNELEEVKDEDTDEVVEEDEAVEETEEEEVESEVVVVESEVVVEEVVVEGLLEEVLEAIGSNTIGATGQVSPTVHPRGGILTGAVQALFGAATCDPTTVSTEESETTVPPANSAQLLLHATGS